jgi:hypothetical protein
MNESITTQLNAQQIEDDGFITVSPVIAAHPSASDMNLRAALTRIERKTHIMVLDAEHHSSARQDAEEIRQLAQIALRALAAEAQP